MIKLSKSISPEECLVKCDKLIRTFSNQLSKYEKRMICRKYFSPMYSLITVSPNEQYLITVSPTVQYPITVSPTVQYTITVGECSVSYHSFIKRHFFPLYNFRVLIQIDCNLLLLFILKGDQRQ